MSVWVCARGGGGEEVGLQRGDWLAAGLLAHARLQPCAGEAAAHVPARRRLSMQPQPRAASQLRASLPAITARPLPPCLLQLVAGAAPLTLSCTTRMRLMGPNSSNSRISLRSVAS